MSLKDLKDKLVSKFGKAEVSKDQKLSNQDTETSQATTMAQEALEKLNLANLRKISFKYNGIDILLLPQVRELFGLQSDKELIEQVLDRAKVDSNAKDKKHVFLITEQVLNNLAQTQPQQAKIIKQQLDSYGYSEVYAFKIPGVYYLTTFLKSNVAKHIRNDMVSKYIELQETSQGFLSLAKRKLCSLNKTTVEAEIHEVNPLKVQGSLLSTKALIPEEFEPFAQAFRKLEVEIATLKQQQLESKAHHAEELKVLKEKLLVLSVQEQHRERMLQAYLGLVNPQKVANTVSNGSIKETDNPKPNDLVFTITEPTNNWLVSLNKYEDSDISNPHVSQTIPIESDKNEKPDDETIREFLLDFMNQESDSQKNSQAASLANSAVSNSSSSDTVGAKTQVAQKNKAEFKKVIQSAKESIHLITPILDKELLDLLLDVKKNVGVTIVCEQRGNCSQSDYDKYKVKSKASKNVIKSIPAKVKERGYFISIDWCSRANRKNYQGATFFTDCNNAINLKEMNSKSSNVLINNFMSGKAYKW